MAPCSRGGGEHSYPEVVEKLSQEENNFFLSYTLREGLLYFLRGIWYCFGNEKRKSASDMV